MAKVQAAKVSLENLGSALEMYKLDNGVYPTTDQGLHSLVEKPSGAPEPRNYRPGGYLDAKSVPKDPWGNEYRYLQPGTKGGAYDLCSFGADGEPEGEETDADICSWNLQ